MAASSLASRIEAVRRFSRFYTRRIGVLEETLLHSPFTLPEGRLVYEIANRDRPTAQELCRDLGLDPGYVSRLLQGLEKSGCVARKRSTTDKRQTELTLTAKGQRLWAAMNERSRQDIANLLAELPIARQDRLVKALETVESLLDEPPEKRVPFTLRPHQPGDIGWIIRRQTQLYATEYGWDGSFEAMLAEISGKVHRQVRPEIGQLLDRRAQRRDRGIGLPGARRQDHRTVPHALRRAVGARARHRPAPGRGVHRRTPAPRATGS